MDLRRVTGYLAHTLLALHWLWVLTRTAPVLRRGCRDRPLRLRLTLLRTAALGWTALFVATVHFWATSWWHVVVALPVALAGGAGLQRVYRRLVAPPRHRVALSRRVRRTGHFPVIRRPGVPGPHRHAAVEAAPRNDEVLFELRLRRNGGRLEQPTAPQSTVVEGRKGFFVQVVSGRRGKFSMGECRGC